MICESSERRTPFSVAVFTETVVKSEEVRASQRKFWKYFTGWCLSDVVA